MSVDRPMQHTTYSGADPDEPKHNWSGAAFCTCGNCEDT